MKAPTIFSFIHGGPAAAGRALPSKGDARAGIPQPRDVPSFHLRLGRSLALPSKEQLAP